MIHGFVKEKRSGFGENADLTKCGNAVLARGNVGFFLRNIARFIILFFVHNVGNNVGCPVGASPCVRP